MKQTMKKNLEVVIDSIVNEDADTTSIAFHDYIQIKTKSILGEWRGEYDEDPIDFDPSDDDPDYIGNKDEDDDYEPEDEMDREGNVSGHTFKKRPTPLRNRMAR